MKGWLPALFLCLAACGRTSAKVEEPVDAGEQPDVDAGPEPITESEKLDVLFVIDNTLTAHPAHETLARTIPYFLDRLVNPRCANGLGQIVDEPAPNQPCALGVRDFAPVADLHVGIVSSSIGGHGADTCSPAAMNFNPQQNDGANLLTRNDAGGVVPTYEGLGFLAWDPEQKRSPPGDSDPQSFVAKLQEMIGGVGNQGCGFEAHLESFYRFLVEPNPYDQIVVEGGEATLVGTDKTLLEQRAAFLRPDSVLLIVVLADEDDCSTRDGGVNWLSMQTFQNGGSYHLPRPRDECAIDPEDECCASCGQNPPPAGCPPSPGCQLGSLTAEEDPAPLRCFDQKRRFGLDFLYPVERYVDGLNEPEVADRDGEIVANPLFVAGRTHRLVLLAGIVGVPWQDIANAPTNLAAGFVPGPDVVWDRIVGTFGDPPEDPLMVPSLAPRGGSHPITGDELAPPNATSPQANPINGHEHQVPNELQYACIYRLETPRLCVDATCECTTAQEFTTNPVCQEDSGAYGTTQRFGRATPATRALRVIQALGPQGTVASLCTEPVFSTAEPAFGYKPAVDALVRALRGRLVPFEDQ